MPPRQVGYHLPNSTCNNPLEGAVVSDMPARGMQAMQKT